MSSGQKIFSTAAAAALTGAGGLGVSGPAAAVPGSAGVMVPGVSVEQPGITINDYAYDIPGPAAAETWLVRRRGNGV